MAKIIDKRVKAVEALINYGFHLPESDKWRKSEMIEYAKKANEQMNLVRGYIIERLLDKSSEQKPTSGDLNLNEYVWVKLTDKGRELHKENHEKLMEFLKMDLPYEAPAESDDGWSKWQLWVLMKEFGQHLEIGFDPVFEPVIRIEYQQGSLYHIDDGGEP